MRRYDSHNVPSFKQQLPYNIITLEQTSDLPKSQERYVDTTIKQISLAFKVPF